MVVQHNISAMTANRYYGVNNKGLAGSLEKLASGYAINKAGDNAAGLAVSEKMRAQIGGLTQASKNAEDGISLVQTMEGALQETDSILQRMRTLAVQSANGSYQDDVDREAMQLEFDQLNDELNQIADTDFNGVVMLNGGQMADGLKAVDGKFDYSSSVREAKQLGSQNIHAFSAIAMDDPKSGATRNGTESVANGLWKDLGFDRSTDKTKGPDSIDVTFKYNATDKKWTAVSATGGISKDNLANLKVNTDKNNGGFQVGSTNSTGATVDEKNNVANVVVDSNDLVDGDTITLTFNNPSVTNSAAENIAVSSVDASGLTVGTDAAAPTKTEDLRVEVKNTKFESTNGSGTDSMTEDIDKFFKLMDGAKVSVTYANTKAGAAVGLIGADNNQSVKISWTDPDTGNPTEVVLSKSGTGNDNKADITIGQTTFTFDGGTTDGTITVGVNGGTAKTIKTGYELLEFGITKNAAVGTTAPDAAASNGTVVFTLSNAASTYSEGKVANAVVKEPANVVSKSDAYGQSKAKMTYTDHLSLQVGARTKDQVDFTFRYDSNGLGDLKANMNCSSRTDGLGTADLSIADQKSANDAIDKIDNAINKISMVRATFGAAQNRLEHKINNIDTNTENLTAAESRIRDTQMDKEMMKFTSSQILSQASQSMLAQANQLPQGVLQLLG